MTTSWEARCGDKLVDADDAAKLIHDGDFVTLAMGSVWMAAIATTRAVVARAAELTELRVDSSCSLVASLGAYDHPHKPISTETFFAIADGERKRLTNREPDADYVPLNPHLIGTKSGRAHRADFTKRHSGADVCVVPITAPDQDGNVTFGHQIWLARVQASRASKLIGEVVEGVSVIPGGDNTMPLNRFDAIVRGRRPLVPYAKEVVPPEEVEATDACGGYVASLVDDGDTVMFGAGTIPIRMGSYLADKQDLGCHTELVCPLELVRSGVINGARRNVSRGRVTTTAVLPRSEEEHAWLDGNTAFELRDMTVNNDPRYIAANDNLVAINAPAEISLWGEIGVERVGNRYLRGIGGQIEFVMGALMSDGGRSVHAALSTKLDSTGERLSTIVPELLHPGIATVPRHLTDFVVTEYGIASLLGKTERQRAHELIAIAHPDYRSELTEAAKRMFGLGRRTFVLEGSHV